MRAYHQLARHPFVSYVSDSVEPVLLRAGEDFGTVPKDYSDRQAWRAKNRARYTPAARFLGIIMGRTFNLLRMFEQLERARYLMGRSPRILGSGENSIDRSQWTQYHFFVFTASIPAIVDCCLLLAAETYRLGLPPRLCSFDLVTSHEWIAPDVVKALKKLRADLQKDVQRRHRLLHRGEEADIGELTDSEWLLDLNAMTLVDSAGRGGIDRRLLATAWRGTVRQLQHALDTTEAAALDGTQRLLSALLPQLKDTMESLGPLVGGSGSPTTR
jgi:hypothetical protein